MKRLLTFTAILEVLTVLAMVTASSFAVWVLTGTSLNEAAGMIMAKITGAVLLTLAIACFLSRNNAGASGVIKAMAFYNIAAAGVLQYSAIGFKLSGIGLWLTFLSHAGLTALCFAYLRQLTPDK